VVAADGLDERVPCTHHSRTAELCETAHRPQPGRQPSVIGFDGVVHIVLGDMAGGGHQLIDHPQVGGRAVGGDLGRGRSVLECAGEESAGARQIPLRRHQHIDDLPELVDCPVHVTPPTGDLDVGFVDEPAITGRMSARSCRVDQQRGEPLHPAIDRNVVYFDAALSEQLFHVAVGQPVARVPTHRQHDDLAGKRNPAKTRLRRRCSTVTTAHQLSLLDLALRQRNSPLLINPLVSAGYPSIGCAPCTRAVAAGEDPRAGRWAGSAKTERGIHR
jgi:hypothetical protein